MVKMFQVSGMTCQGCVQSVTKAIQALASDAYVQVDLASGKVAVKGSIDAKLVAQAVENAGFGYGGEVPVQGGCGCGCAH